MSLSLQPAVTSTPVDGLSAQSRDGAVIQSISFGEVLKVEEKKLQQEQETSAQSVAALLATMQPPAMKELMTGIIKATPDGVNDPTALTVDSVQSTVVAPQLSAPLTSNVAVSPQKVGAAAKDQQSAKDNVSNAKVAPASTPTTDTEKTGVKLSTQIQENNSISTGSSQPVITSTQQGETDSVKQQPSVAQAKTRSDESSQTPTKTNIPSTKVTVPVIETDQEPLAAASQPYTPIFESSQLVEKKGIPAPAPSSSARAGAKVENQVKAEQQPLSAEMKSNIPVEGSAVAEKGTTPQNNDAPATVKVETTVRPQADLPVNTVLRDVPITADAKAITSVQVDAQLVSDIPQQAEAVDTLSVKNATPVVSSEPVILEEKVTVSTQANTPVYEATKADTANIKRSSADDTVHNEDAAMIADQEIRADKKTPVVNFTADEPESTDRTAMASPHIPAVKAGSIDDVENVQNRSAGMDSKIETSQPVAEPILSNQAATVADELPQTVRKANTPVAEVIVSQSETVPVVEPNQKSTVSAAANAVEQPQTDVVENEIPQPVSKTNISAAKVIAEQGRTVAAETNIEIDQNPFVEEVEPTQVTQTEAVAEKSETNSQPFTAAKKLTQPVQPEVSVDTNPQIATEVNVPAEKAAVVDETVESVAQPVNAPEVRQGGVEPILKNKDAKAEAVLGVDNVTVENRPGTMSKLQVGNETFAVVQENAPVGVQSEVAAKSAGVGIRSDKKVEAKEPDLEIGSTGVIAGVEKGVGNLEFVKKSSVAQVDPVAMDVIEQITNQMKVRIQSGETSVRIKLNPEKMGAIEVQMTHSAQGISVSFITEHASTGQLLESQVSQLRQSLKDAGVQLANLNISQHQQQPNQEGGSFKQGQQFVQNPRRDVPQVETSSTERARPQRIGGQTSEIDYLV